MGINCLPQDEEMSTLTRQNYSSHEGLQVGSECRDESLSCSDTTLREHNLLTETDPIQNATSQSHFVVSVGWVLS